MSGVCVAVVQLCSSAEVNASLRHLDDVLSDLKPDDVDAVFLPENFAALAATNPRAIGDAETYGAGEIKAFVAGKAKGLGTYIFAGTLPLTQRPGGQPVPEHRVRAASLVFSPMGEIIARYDKQHLFDAEVKDELGRYQESATFEAGDAITVVNTTFGQVGLSVCYDIRYPEMYTEMTQQGAQILAVPSAFTRVTGVAHFGTLVRARAIENACFVIAACQSGGHDSGRETYGHSQIVSPWGEVMACLPEGPGIVTQQLDFNFLDQVRLQLPAWRRL